MRIATTGRIREKARATMLPWTCPCTMTEAAKGLFSWPKMAMRPGANFRTITHNETETAGGGIDDSEDDRGSGTAAHK